MRIKEIQKRIHEVNIANGWWEEDRNVGETLMLIVTEVAEAMEDYRNSRMETFFSAKLHQQVRSIPAETRFFISREEALKHGVSTEPKPEGFHSEIADIVIRCLDLAEAHGIDLEKEIKQKVEYNSTRGYRHGGKKA